MKKKLSKIVSCVLSAIMAFSAMSVTAIADDTANSEENAAVSALDTTQDVLDSAATLNPEVETSSDDHSSVTVYYKIIVPFDSHIMFSYDTYDTKGDTSLINLAIASKDDAGYSVKTTLNKAVTMNLIIPKGTYFLKLEENDQQYEDFCYHLYPDNLAGYDRVKIYDETNNSYHFDIDYYLKAVSGGGNVTIYWKPVKGATSYRVYRWQNGKYTRLAIRTSTYYIDTVAETGEEYGYYVSAYDANTEVESSMVKANGYRNVTVTDDFAKSLEIKSASVLSTSVTLKWDVVPGATSYRIYRRNDDGTRKLLAVQSMTEYKDTGLTKGKVYKYEIRAYSKTTGALSAYSPIKQARPMAAPTITSGNVKGKITWDKNAVATSYRVYRADSLTGAKKLLAPTKLLTYTDTTAEKGKTYYYFVAAYDNNTGTLSAYSKAKAIKIA